MPAALTDIHNGLGRIDLAATLAWEDLQDRYRRSVIGVSWILLSFLAFILIKAVVFAGLFDKPGYDYFSHLVIGFALFQFISSTITSGASVFVSNRTWILSSDLPYSLYMHTLTLRSLAELGLIGVAAATLVASMGNTEPAYLWSLPFVIILYYITAMAISMAIAPIVARFRDVIHAIQTVMRIAFFATPVIWVLEPGTLRGTIATWNPLTYYLDLVRVPVIEGRFPIQSWIICLAISLGVCLIGVLVFSKLKRWIPRWL